MTRNLWIFIIIFVFQVVGIFQAKAAYVYASIPAVVNYNERTHIFFLARANDLNSAPTLAALSALARLKSVSDRYDQVVVLVAVKDQSEAKNLSGLGLPNAEFRDKLLHVGIINEILLKFDKIASLHYYGHGGIASGMFLDKVDQIDHDLRYNYKNLDPKLASHFTADSFVKLNACNQGQILGPKMSQIWNVPIAAAIAGTHFEVIHEDGSFYWAEPESRKSYTKNWNDYRNGAFRMKPSHFTFVHIDKDKHEKEIFNRGLPFFKFFCSNLSLENCQKRMALAMLSSVTSVKLSQNSGLDDFKLATRDWLCPSGRWGDLRQRECMATLDRAEKKYQSTQVFSNVSAFLGNPAKCDMKSCFILEDDKSCLESPWNVWKCTTRELKKSEQGGSNALEVEYQNYIQGFKLLKGLK